MKDGRCGECSADREGGGGWLRRARHHHVDPRRQVSPAPACCLLFAVWCHHWLWDAGWTFASRLCPDGMSASQFRVVVRLGQEVRLVRVGPRRPDIQADAPRDHQGALRQGRPPSAAALFDSQERCWVRLQAWHWNISPQKRDFFKDETKRLEHKSIINTQVYGIHGASHCFLRGSCAVLRPPSSQPASVAHVSRFPHIPAPKSCSRVRPGRL